jgi:hypothetical protein
MIDYNYEDADHEAIIDYCSELEIRNLTASSEKC